MTVKGRPAPTRPGDWLRPRSGFGRASAIVVERPLMISFGEINAPSGIAPPCAIIVASPAALRCGGWRRSTAGIVSFKTRPKEKRLVHRRDGVDEADDSVASASRSSCATSGCSLSHLPCCRRLRCLSLFLPPSPRRVIPSSRSAAPVSRRIPLSCRPDPLTPLPPSTVQ
jgi:hypothetical protein